jgi:CxC1 like cysteine cluster associated with KDZ transposases
MEETYGFPAYISIVSLSILLTSCWLTVFVEGIERIELHICKCSTAALQLLSRSLFPCAPLEPSLAVDLKMLQFAKELHLRSPPNNTAWCEALETFLESRGYKLQTRVCTCLLTHSMTYT